MHISQLPPELQEQLRAEQKKERQREAFILPTQKVKLVSAGRHHMVQFMTGHNTKKAIERLSESEYVVLSTGEVKEYQRTEKRADRLDSLYRTFRELRWIINANFTGASNERFVTLTFDGKDFPRPTVGDIDVLQKCVRRFYRRLRKKFGEIVALWVLEPHADGHAHLHVLIKFLESRGYVEYNDLISAWGCGIVDIRRLHDVDNIGAYVSAYLTDMPLSEIEGGEIKESDEVVEKNGKKYIKAGRLQYYPSGKRLYSITRNAKRATSQKMNYFSALRKIGKEEPDYATSKKIPVGDKDLKIVWQHFKADN